MIDEEVRKLTKADIAFAIFMILFFLVAISFLIFAIVLFYQFKGIGTQNGYKKNNEQM